MDLSVITDAYNWIINNPIVVAQTLGAAWMAISVLVAVTPTKADDRALGRARRVLERGSFLQPRNSPGILSMPGAKARRP